MAVQVYSPPCDVFNGENVCSTELLPAARVEVEDSISTRGSTTRPGTTLAEQLME